MRTLGSIRCSGGSRVSGDARRRTGMLAEQVVSSFRTPLVQRHPRSIPDNVYRERFAPRGKTRVV